MVGRVGKLIPVRDGIAEVVQGFSELIISTAKLELQHARQVLESRFSSTEIVDRLGSCYRMMGRTL